MRADKKFIKEINEIKAMRRLNVDKDLPRELSNERITKALTEFPEWDIIKQRLIKEPRKEKLKWS